LDELSNDPKGSLDTKRSFLFLFILRVSFSSPREIEGVF